MNVEMIGREFRVASLSAHLHVFCYFFFLLLFLNLINIVQLLYNLIFVICSYSIVLLF